MKTSKKLNRHRSLRIETLEEREMLSVNPLVPLIAENTTDLDSSFHEPDCVSPAVTENATAAIISAEAAEVPEGYNAYEWNLVESQGLVDYAKWEGGRLISINTQNLDLKITTLDVSGCTSLVRLNCMYNNNQLTLLDVSGCTRLEMLFCNSSEIMSLNVSGCTSLITLDCSNNLLTSLDLGGTGFVDYTTVERTGSITYTYTYTYPDSTKRTLVADTDTQIVFGALVLATPTNFKAEPLESRNVILTWDAVPDATHYQIYWKNTSGKNIVIGTSKTTSFRTPRVANGANTFYIYAWADGVCGEKYASVTTVVGTSAALSPLEAAFVEYSVEYSAEYAEL